MADCNIEIIPMKYNIEIKSIRKTKVKVSYTKHKFERDFNYTIERFGCAVITVNSYSMSNYIIVNKYNFSLIHNDYVFLYYNDKVICFVKINEIEKIM